MDITGLCHTISLETPVVTVMALSVICGSALAQSANAQAELSRTFPNADSILPASPAETFDLLGSRFTSDEVDYPATGKATQRRLRPFGAGSNGAPRYSRYFKYSRFDFEVVPWRNFAGLQSADLYRAGVSEVSSRWWFSTGLTDIGFGVGSAALMAQPMFEASAFNASDAGIVLASSPSLSLGIRHRTSAASTVYADATRTRSIGVSGIDGYSGKVGVEWKSAESRWNVAYSGLGMRLSSESRMTLSLRKGGLGIYMRSQF